MTDINVCCLKWGTKYSADYVNRLAAMVRRNLNLPHRFICFTDDSSGVHASIECKPLLEEGLPGWWHKLSLFKSSVLDLKGTVLFLDLDILIVSGLEPFLEYRAGAFCIIKDWLPTPFPFFNSSVFRIEIGTHAYVYDNFINSDPQKVLATFRGDQNWISKQVPGAAVWPAKWCVSFKWQCALPRPNNPIIPDDAKIIVFHGKPDLHEAMSGSYPIYGPKQLVPQDNVRGGPASWIGDFWNLEGLDRC